MAATTRPQARPKAWPTTDLLLALATLAPKAGARITAAQLAAAARHLSADQRNNGTTRLGQLGYLRHKVVTLDGQAVHTFTVTADGAAAIAAAQGGRRITSGGRGARAHLPGSVATRVWALLRIRKVLDADSAARLLCDAGDSNFRHVREGARKALSRWAADGVLQVSQQPIPTGTGGSPRQRYVLVADPGPVAPPWLARGGAAE